MRPENERIWRKNRRASWKQIGQGRRSTHQARIEPPRRSSTWLRRHPGPDNLEYYLENAR